MKANVSPPLAATIGIAAALRDEYRRYTVRQSFGQQVGGSFLAYAANLQIGASLECAVFDVLGLVGKDYLRQGCFSGKSAVAKLLAESIGRDAIGGIDVKAVGMRTVLSGVHTDGCIGDVQYLQFLEFIAQVAEIHCIQLALQDKVGNLVRFFFGEHFHQSTGFGNGISPGSLGGDVRYHNAQSGY